MSNENFKGHENWDEREGDLTHASKGDTDYIITQSLRYRRTPRNPFSEICIQKKKFF